MNSSHRAAALARIVGPVAAVLIASSPLAAQTAPAPSAAAAPASQDQIVQMSAFQVTTTQGVGYVEGNAAGAFKTNESLMDIPQADVVMTSDLIKDTGYVKTSDVLAYAGVAAQYSGDALAMRGVRIQYPYIDDTPDNAFETDDSIIDSVEVIKGPAESLYVNASISGLVLKQLKNPLPYDQDIITFGMDQWGMFRTTGDFTGPIGNIGDVNLSYRLVLAYQKAPDSGYYFQHYRDNHVVTFPVLQLQYHGTLVRLSYNSDVEDQTDSPNNQDLISPDGKLYTGAGRDVNNTIPNALDNHDYLLHLDVFQKISDNWENKLTASDWVQNRYGEGAIVDGYDWPLQKEYFTASLTRQWWRYWTVLDDTTGHYNLGPSNWSMKNTDIFGFLFSDWVSDPRGISSTSKGENMLIPWSDTAQGIPLLPGQPANTLAVAMNSAAALSNFPVPTAADYSNLPDEGSHLETVFSALYWQHSIDVIPKWLSLVAGFTLDNVDTISVSNVSVVPWVATQEPYRQWVHRVGAVLHLSNDVMLYALDSTSFTPQSQGYIDIYGNLPPPQGGYGRELGMKTDFFNGRLSSEFAWFQLTTTNVFASAGPALSPYTGETYYVNAGNTKEEGVDGDLAFTLVPGWQLIGSFYAGHDRDENGNPLPVTYDNEWSLFTRYAFRTGLLHHLAVGGGVARYGGRWIQDSGIYGVTFSPYTQETGMMKEEPMTETNLFADYTFNQHWSARLTCQNVLNWAYPVGMASAYAAVASFPRTFGMEIDWKY